MSTETVETLDVATETTPAAKTDKPLSLRKEKIKVLKVNVKTGVRTGRWCGNYTMSQVRQGC